MLIQFLTKLSCAHSAPFRSLLLWYKLPILTEISSSFVPYRFHSKNQTLSGQKFERKQPIQIISARHIFDDISNEKKTKWCKFFSYFISARLVTVFTFSKSLNLKSGSPSGFYCLDIFSSLTFSRRCENQTVSKLHKIFEKSLLDLLAIKNLSCYRLFR